MNLLHQFGSKPWITDGGLETSLIFLHGIDLADFAAFPLLETDQGRAELRRYLSPYLDLAERLDTGILADTPTWRANEVRGAQLGYDARRLQEVNRAAVGFVTHLLAQRPGLRMLVNGVIGPRGDGYVVGATMTADEAAEYHTLQTRAFADAGADVVSAITMTYADEAIGVVRAAAAVGLPSVVSFTVETDGRLPSGQSLGDAIDAVDNATASAPAYYMINCAHPTHFDGVLADGGSWIERVSAIRANASSMSHAELDQATELDRGDPEQLAREYKQLRDLLPDLAVVGGCCGTDHEHVTAIATALIGAS